MEFPYSSDGWSIKPYDKRTPRRTKGRDLNDDEVAKQLVSAQSLARLFQPQNVYNCDETILYWKRTPDQELRNERFDGTKTQMQKVTAHLCCNADGSDKVPIWLIGTHPQPLAFRAANIEIGSLACQLRHNGSASMSVSLMIAWLRWFDRRMAGRKVLLMLDDLDIHIAAIAAVASEPPENVFICWIPARASAQWQPIDRGIATSFKAQYRLRWLRYMAEEFDAGRQPLRTMNILKAVRMSIAAWSAVSSTTIVNFWQLSGLLPRPEGSDATDPETTQASEQVATLIRQLKRQKRITRSMHLAEFLNSAQEQLKDTPPNDLDIQIVAQICPGPDHDSDEEVEVVPKMHPKEALHILDRLQLFEEQQQDADYNFIEVLGRYRTVLEERLDRGSVPGWSTAYSKTL